MHLCFSLANPVTAQSTPQDAVQALPNVIMPYVDSRLRTMGTGFMSLMARGMEAPPRTKDASRLISIPYGCLFWMRKPPSASCSVVSAVG